jgi:hypothetical protein
MNIISAYRNLVVVNYIIRPYASRITLVAIVAAIKAPAEVVTEKDVIVEGIIESSTL